MIKTPDLPPSPPPSTPPIGATMRDYLREAFFFRWNLLFFSAGAIAAGLLPMSEVLLPLVGAAELTYLAGLVSIPRFRAAIDAKTHALRTGGSVAATPPQSVVYSATKSALDGVTRVLAKELGSRNIRVNSINPGGVETKGTHSSGIVGSDFANQMIARTPLGRFGQPEDIAPIAVFLASPESSWLTGEIITASGGLS